MFSRDLERPELKVIGQCSTLHCLTEIEEGNIEACKDDSGNLFCCKECMLKYYGYEELY